MLRKQILIVSSLSTQPMQRVSVPCKSRDDQELILPLQEAVEEAFAVDFDTCFDE